MKFDASGDGLGLYNIYNFRQVQMITKESEANPDQLDSEAALSNTQAHSDDSGAFTSNEPDSSHSANGELGSDPNVYSREGSYVDTSLVSAPILKGAEIKYEYAPVGRWTGEDDYYIDFQDIQFIQGERQRPESYCSKPCDLGQAKIMRAGDHCCWICRTCAPHEFLPDEFSCEDCGIGRWPKPDKRSCFDLPQKYLRWSSIYSIISLSVASLGLAITLFVTIIFIKYIDTPVVKASGRELSFILLAGIACCHLSTPVLLSKPTAFICGSQRFLVSIWCHFLRIWL